MDQRRNWRKAGANDSMLQKKMKLRALRVNAGLTREEAAAALSVSCQTLSNYENGITYPDVPAIERIKQLYGVSYEDIQWKVGEGICLPEL